MMGLEFPGDIPFRDVYVHSVIQAPDGRRMSKSLGTGIDPLEEIDAHGADALRFGLLAMSSSQDVRYSRAQGPTGPRPREQDLERLAPGPAQRRRRPSPRRGRSVSRTAGSSPGWSARSSSVGRASTPTTSPTPRSSSTASSGPSSATGTSRSSSRGSTTASQEVAGEPALRARAGARAGAPDDALRHRGDLELPAASARGPLVVSPFPAADPQRVDEAAEAEIGAAIELTRGLRRWRDLAGVAAGAVLPARRGDGRAARARRPPGAPRARRRRGRDARDRRPGRDPRRPRSSTPSRSPQRIDGAPRAAALRGRARRAQARQRGLRREGAAGGRRGRAREARALSGGARGAGRYESPRRRAYLGRSSRSAGASGSTASGASRGARHAPAALRARSTSSARTASRRWRR